MEVEQMNRNTLEKELLKAKDERNINVTTAEKDNKKQSDAKSTEQEGVNPEVNGKNKGMEKATEQEKCSPERVMKKEKDAEEEKRGGSAKKKAIYSFFGKLFLRSF